MRYSLSIAFLISASLYTSAHATSWGLNSFSDSVYWSDSIAVANVLQVERRHAPPPGSPGSALGKVDITVQIVDQFKGHLPERIRVTEVELGDPKLNSSPYVPLPKPLVGERLLLFLTYERDSRIHKGYMRFLVKGPFLRHIAFSDLNQSKIPLRDIRTMIAELNLIQAACPRDKSKVLNEDAALAACRTALYSNYDPVMWYGARRLLDRKIPSKLSTDLMAALKDEEAVFPVAYLLVQCLGSVGDKKAVPVLIEFLRKTPRTSNDSYTVKALHRITGEKFGTDIQRWQEWWEAHNDNQN